MSLTVDDKALQTMCTMSEGGKLFYNTDITRTFRPSAPGRALREPTGRGAAVSLSTVDPVYAHLFVSLSGATRSAPHPPGLPVRLSACLPVSHACLLLPPRACTSAELVLTHLAVQPAQADALLTLQGTLLLEALLVRFTDFRWQHPPTRVDSIILNVRKAAEYVAHRPSLSRVPPCCCVR